MIVTKLLIGLLLSVAVVLSGACSKGGAGAGTGSYEENVAAYCRAIQSGDYDAAVPLTVVGAENLRRAEKGPAFERDASIAELRKLQRVDIERYYKQILPPSAQWKILETGESKVRGQKLVFVEIGYPVKGEADFTEELNPQTLQQIKHRIKNAVYVATLEEKSKLLVDLPNFSPLALYKTQVMWE